MSNITQKNQVLPINFKTRILFFQIQFTFRDGLPFGVYFDFETSITNFSTFDPDNSDIHAAFLL